MPEITLSVKSIDDGNIIEVSCVLNKVKFIIISLASTLIKMHDYNIDNLHRLMCFLLTKKMKTQEDLNREIDKYSVISSIDYTYILKNLKMEHNLF